MGFIGGWLSFQRVLFCISSGTWVIKAVTLPMYPNSALPLRMQKFLYGLSVVGLATEEVQEKSSSSGRLKGGSLTATKLLMMCFSRADSVCIY